MATIFFILSSITISWAQPDVELIVRNKVVEDVSHCTQEKSKDPLFHVTDTSAKDIHPWYENMRVRGDSNANLLGQVPIGTMVKIGPRTKHLVGSKSYVYSNILRYSRYRSRLRRPTAGLARGYMFGTSIKKPELWKFIVENSFIEDLPNEDDSKFLNNKTLMVSHSSDGYDIIECCEGNNCKSYPVFSIFENESSTPVAYIAALPTDLGFLKKVTPMRNKTSSALQQATAINETTNNPHHHGFKSGSILSNAEKKQKDSAPLKVSLRPQKRPETLEATVPAESSSTQESYAPTESLRPKARPSVQTTSSLVDSFFPTLFKPLKPFTSGIRKFAAGRGGGRKHAGCDLYRPAGEKVVAIQAGTILRIAGFKKGTDAIEVRTDDGKIHRYAEVNKKKPPEIKKGARVRAGQTLGYIGKMRGIKNTMLHFEKYAGTATGRLTNTSRWPFKRRRDLENPTEMLLSLDYKSGVYKESL